MRLTMPCRPGWTAWRTRADNAIQALPNADGTPHLHAAASRAKRRIPSLGPWPQWMRSSELSEPNPISSLPHRKEQYVQMYACIRNDDYTTLLRAKRDRSKGERSLGENLRTPTLARRGCRGPGRVRAPEPCGPCGRFRLRGAGSHERPILRYVPRLRCRPDGCPEHRSTPLRTAVDG